MIMLSYNVLQKRLIFQKYKKMFSWIIRNVAIRSGSIRWISIRFDSKFGTVGIIRYFDTKVMISVLGTPLHLLK